MVKQRVLTKMERTILVGAVYNCVVRTYKNYLTGVILMITHSMFYGEILKIVILLTNTLLFLYDESMLKIYAPHL